MVWAEKFFLQVRVAGGDGEYDKNGTKVSDGSKLVPRYFVAKRNAINNNELYVINEEETNRLMALRSENVAKKEEERKLKSVSQTDVLGAIASGMEKLTQSKGGEEEKPKRKRRTKEEIEAEKGNTND